MNNWTAMKKGDLMMEIFLAEQNMENDLFIFWNKIKIQPEVWQCNDVIEDNFWIVAKHENHIIWYNDITEGFTISRFKSEGFILEFRTSKNDLDLILKQLIQQK